MDLGGGVLDSEDEVVAAYWHAFDAHLQTLPITDVDTEKRHALVATARSLHRSEFLPDEAPSLAATRAHRLRYELGPTLSAEEIAAERRALMEEAADLLAAGCDPDLLGLRNWGGPLG